MREYRQTRAEDVKIGDVVIMSNRWAGGDFAVLVTDTPYSYHTLDGNIHHWFYPGVGPDGEKLTASAFSDVGCRTLPITDEDRALSLLSGRPVVSI